MLFGTSHSLGDASNSVMAAGARDLTEPPLERGRKTFWEQGRKSDTLQPLWLAQSDGEWCQGEQIPRIRARRKSLAVAAGDGGPPISLQGGSRKRADLRGRLSVNYEPSPVKNVHSSRPPGLEGGLIGNCCTIFLFIIA